MLDEQTTPPPPSDEPPTDAPPPLAEDAPGVVVVDAPVATPKKKKRRGGKPDPAASASSPPRPFAGGPPEDAKREARARDEDDGASSPGAMLAQVAADPDAAAAQLAGVADGIFMYLVQARWQFLEQVPHPLTKKPMLQELLPTKEQKEGFVAALALFLKAAAVQLSPTAGLVVAAAATYGLPAFQMEATRAAIMKQMNGAKK